MAHWPSFDDSRAGTESAASRRKTRKPDLAIAATVPAVERAIAILRHLEISSDPATCTVSGISRALDLNKSTCSNILRTLGSSGFIEYEAVSKAYRLGAGLIGLGIKARHRQFPAISMTHLQALVRQTGFTCVAFEQLPNGEFIIVGKVDSPKDIKVTIDVGQHFPPSAPVFARIALAWSSAADIDSFFARGKLQRFTRLSRTEPAEVRAELERIRRVGYTVSSGEYYLANTAIAAPVFSAQRDICRGVCMVAFSSEVPEDQTAQYGEAVRDAGRAITQAMEGSPTAG